MTRMRRTPIVEIPLARLRPAEEHAAGENCGGEPPEHVPVPLSEQALDKHRLGSGTRTAGDAGQCKPAPSPVADISLDKPRSEVIATHAANNSERGNGGPVQLVEILPERHRSETDIAAAEVGSEPRKDLHNGAPQEAISWSRNQAGAGPAHEPANDQAIGQILVAARRLGSGDVERVLSSAERNGLRFGDAAIQMGLLQPDDVAFALARQFAFPYIARGDTRLSKDLLAVFAPDHPTVKQLRALRGQIALRSAGGPPVVAIVSPNRGDGRSFVAANLAAVFTQLGQRTLLIDACLRNPSLHGYFKMDLREGLSTSLARPGHGAARPIDALPGLQVIPAGPMPPNPLELIEQGRFSQLLERAAQQFEVVIIDTPAGTEGPEAALLANRAGAAVMIARSCTTREVEARRFATALEHARTKVLGLVFNE